MSRYLYMDDKRIAGPVDLNEIRAVLATGAITLDTGICPEGQSDWKPLREFKELVPPSPVAPEFEGLEGYYRREFQAIRDSGEVYKGKWNWAAFVLGPLWALIAGAWLSALVAVVISALTYGIGALVFAVVFGVRGTWIYYNARIKRQQLVV